MDLAIHAHEGRSTRENVRADRAPGPTIWAVASGKGGVGKSVLCSNLAIGLSQTGPRVVAVDLDLGGANLHTIFGCERARHTLTDFLRGRVRSLEEALSPTSVPGVRLLSGARGALDIANASHAHKLKILRALKRIDAGHVVLDLGAGTHFHTLDAFIAADRRILVVTPEATAIENAYYFLKAAFFRALREVAREPEVREVLASVLDEARRSGATPRELIEAASRADARVGARLRARMRAFDVDLVVNRAEGARGRDPGAEIATAGRDLLGANLRWVAAIATDASVPASLERGVPVMQLFPGSDFSRDVQQLVARLIAGEPLPTARAHAPEPVVAPETIVAPAPVVVPAPVAPPLPAFHGASPGRYLRHCRERRGLDLTQLHERTRIRPHHLESIEMERFDALPDELYLRQYVRQVAQVLGVPEAEQVAHRFVECARSGRGACVDSPTPTSVSDLGSPRAVPSAEELISMFDDEPELVEFACEPAPKPLHAVTSAAELATYLDPRVLVRSFDGAARARRRRRRACR